MNTTTLEHSPMPNARRLQWDPVGPPAAPAFATRKWLEVEGPRYERGSLTEVRPSRVDPFGLTLREFLNLSLNETGKLHEEVAILEQQLLDDAWERGAKQVIICDGEIIYETLSNEILSERVKKESEQRNKPCYAFSAPDIIEESSWTSVSGDDFYPTLQVYLSPPNSDEPEKNCISINADFDTGNPETKAFDANQIGILLGELSPYERGIGRHPARSYSYFRKRAKVWVRDESGIIHSTFRDDIRLVEDWSNSALVAYSPNRNGFVSRDLLRILRIRIELDPIKRTTKIWCVA